MFSAWIAGKPQPQGSKKGFLINGKIVLVESSKDLKPWRNKIAKEIVQATNYKKLDGAIHVSLAFYFKKAKSNKTTAHTQKPDIDKTIRACLDAMTGIVYQDDSQVVSINAQKYWASEDQEGVNITVYALDTEGNQIA